MFLIKFISLLEVGAGARYIRLNGFSVSSEVSKPEGESKRFKVEGKVSTGSRWLARK